MQETPRKGSDTKERILDVAEAAVLEKGFAATSIEELVAAVDITKSGFFSRGGALFVSASSPTKPVNQRRSNVR